MVYFLRNLLICFAISIVVVLLLVVQTFFTLRSQEREQLKILEARNELQKLEPPMIHMQELESLLASAHHEQQPVAEQKIARYLQQLKADSAILSSLGSSPEYLDIRQLNGLIHAMIKVSSLRPDDKVEGINVLLYRATLVSKYRSITGAREEKDRQALNAAYGKSIQLTRETFLFVRLISGILLLILLLSFWLIIRELRSRRVERQKLEAFNADLSRKVEETTAVIRKGEEKYRNLFESMTDAYIEVDMEGRIIGSNPAFSKMTGYSPSEIRELHYQDITPAAWHKMEEEIISNQILKTGYSEIYQKEYRHKSGRIIPVELRSFLLKDDDGTGHMWAIVRDISAKKEYQAKLEASEKNLRQALASTTDVFYIIDRDYRILMVNETGKNNLRLRWGNDIRVGANVLDLLPAENLSGIRQRFEKAFAGERVEYEVFQPGRGLPAWVLVTFTPVLDGSGTVVGVSVLGKDITERRLAEEKLRRSEQQLLASIENTPNVAVQWYNEKGEVIFWNNASENIFGWTASEAHGKTLEQLIFQKGESDRYAKLLDQVCRTHKTEGPVEFRFHRKDGREGYCISTIFSIPSEDGNSCVACMDVDITDQKRASAELQEAEAKFRRLVEQSLVGVYIIQDERFSYINPRFAEIFGYTTDELIGKEVWMIIEPGYRNLVRENIRAREAGEIDSVHYELRGFRNDGSAVEAEVFGSRTLYEGRPAIIGTLLDITERKRTENEKEQVRYLLDQRVKELTTLYQVSQIIQKEKMSVEDVMREIVMILPAGWQHDAVAAARIRLGDQQFTTPNFGEAKHRQTAGFPVPSGEEALIEVVYLAECPPEQEDAFLAEERNLINMIGEMLRIYLARQHVAQVNRQMEQQIVSQKIQEQKNVTRAILNAEESERNKIGTELHDNVNQILASSKLFIQMAREKHPPEDSTFLNRGLSLLDQAIQEIRSLSQAQVTPQKEVDLNELIQSLIDRLHDSTSIRATLTFEKTRRIADELKLNIYRIVQEQINNIVKHADATRIDIHILIQENALDVTVRDNGKGFDTSARRKGIGLSNMINRVESFNGELSIISSPGDGCQIKIHIPY